MSQRSATERLRRRGRLRRLLFWGIAIGAIVAAVLLIRCGGGFGFGKGKGLGTGSSLRSGSGTGTGASTGSGASTPVRCAVRVDAIGITVDGKPADIAGAVESCRVAGGADVTVVGDARQGTWEALQAALDAAGVATHIRGAGAPAAVDGGPLDAP